MPGRDQQMSHESLERVRDHLRRIARRCSNLQILELTDTLHEILRQRRQSACDQAGGGSSSQPPRPTPTVFL
jgi:hypothetical protein